MVVAATIGSFLDRYPKVETPWTYSIKYVSNFAPYPLIKRGSVIHKPSVLIAFLSKGSCPWDLQLQLGWNVFLVA